MDVRLPTIYSRRRKVNDISKVILYYNNFRLNKNKV